MAAPTTFDWKQYLPKVPAPPQPPKPTGAPQSLVDELIHKFGNVVPKKIENTIKNPPVGKLGTSDVATIAKKVDPAAARQNDFNQGMAQYGQYFGMDNPLIKELMEIRKQRAMGFDPKERLAMQERGQAGINSQLGTNLRAVQGLAASRGVRGGAVTGMALPSLTQATQARAGLERDIELANMQRRSGELAAYEGLLTGERGSLLSAAMGNAMLGAGDRNNAMTAGLSQQYLDILKKSLADRVNRPEPDKAQPPDNEGPLGNPGDWGRDVSDWWKNTPAGKLFGNFQKGFTEDQSVFDPTQW